MSSSASKTQEISVVIDPRDALTNSTNGNKPNGPKPKFQTKICDHWRRSGSCSYGDACWYAHGEDDLRKVVRIDRSNEEENERPATAEIQKSPTKRASTNVKGLTVNIPSNTAFKEQNSSMPLSPAQERWISMSIGAVPPPTSSAAEKDAISSLSKNGVEQEQEKKHEICSRDDDIDDYGFLSPNPFPYPQQSMFSAGFPSHGHHQRSSNRATQGVPSQQFGGPVNIPGQDPNRLGSGAYHIPPQHQRSRSNVRTSREVGGPPPQFQQAIWNVAGEIYQRQKDIEIGGQRVGPNDRQPTQQKNSEMDRLLSKLKMKDLNYLRFMIERGYINERDVSRQTSSDQMSNGHHFNAPMTPPYHPRLAGNEPNTSDCHYHGTGNRLSNFMPGRHRPPHQHPIHHHHQSQHQLHQHQQYLHHAAQQYRYSHQQGPQHPFAALLSPPEISESLLPPDDSFSIWLEPKPKKQSGAMTRTRGAATINESSSAASLLTKMDALRSDKYPITDEEMMMANDFVRQGDRDDKLSSSESSSPVVMSLMELLSNENLLDQVATEKPKCSMFDFDTLKIAETLKEPLQSSECSTTTSSKMTCSPMFFFVDEKTPNYDGSGSKSLFTPSSSAGQTPSFLEPCDFFAATGSCPFGDACHQSHSI
ncbi:C3H1-type domain-containing protein [Caenorhabditis elegans]|uniref:C3H1-type domain-containing protein n=1 Tax=Caenorhabditis elegans TaxID=6239 RepID=Q4JFB7_CAEEL|nr:C3H1-type domain-containing protein [Caenorhabditis elegans]CAB04667.2 C3H1-type domain-containing protein [Caenorhabditis elegans]|eukprot:NP_492238.2 Uncharacterized protein CELE_T02E1.3 [Caenorhabditis elegans]